MTAASAVAVEITEEPTAVYRFYDRADVLLYVGISYNLASRWANHAAEKDWWPQVARKTVVMYGSRDEAADEEDRAILAEKPIHNIVGREPRKPKRLAAKPLVHQRPTPGPRLDIFKLDPGFQAMVNAYAKENGTTPEGAMSQLVLGGMINAYRRKSATMDDLDEECEALTAISGAFPSSRSPGNVGIAR